MTVSVLMATYNGEKYIKEQLDSIVPYLCEGDELIVSDDGSSDNTLNIVKDYQRTYPMIRITAGEHTGSSTNFASAIPKSRRDILLFCDQDDVWMPEKLEAVKKAFVENPKIELLMHNAGYCDADGNIVEGDIFSKRNPKHGFVQNLMHSTYYGCCMAAKRSFLCRYVPLPDKNVPYDQFFSLIAEKKKTAMFLDKMLILHRYHGKNQSRKMSNVDRLKFRITLWKNVHLMTRRVKE
jgi:glycosyltransferase involved in cell wall biosynthesis